MIDKITYKNKTYPQVSSRDILEQKYCRNSQYWKQTDEPPQDLSVHGILIIS